ncbi:MAG: DUF4314 domain-containing protein [Beduini sp.]
MKEFRVEISKTTIKEVEVNDHSLEEVIDLVQEGYDDKKAVLSRNDDIGTKINVVSKKNLTQIEALRLQYPKGTKIRCIEMNDPYHPIPSGMIGEVEFVDDAGTIHMRWENGSSLGLIIDEDFFEKLEEPIMAKTKE